MVALISYAVLLVVGLIGLHPDFGVKKTNKLIRWTHKWGGRLATGLGWLAAIVGFNCMHADQPLKKFLFAAPLVIASYFVLL